MKDYVLDAKDLQGLRERLAANELTKTDIAFLDELVVSASELQKAIAASSEKVGDKKVIAKLPFGVDLVK